MKRTPANVLLIGAANAVAVIIALAVLAYLTVGREKRRLADSSAADPRAIEVIPFDTGAAPPMVGTPEQSTLVTASTPAIVARLVSFEQAGDYAGALQATLRDSAGLPADERDRLVAWLEERKDSPALPVLFMLARTHQDAGRTDEAARWYMAGSLAGLIDASRFEDASAGQAVREVESQFDDIRRRLRQDPALRVQAVSFALDMEEQLHARQAPLWIAARAQSAVAGEPAKMLEAQAWEERRASYRQMFRTFLDRAQRMSVVELDWEF